MSTRFNNNKNVQQLGMHDETEQSRSCSTANTDGQDGDLMAHEDTVDLALILRELRDFRRDNKTRQRGNNESKY